MLTMYSVRYLDKKGRGVDPIALEVSVQPELIAEATVGNTVVANHRVRERQHLVAEKKRVQKNQNHKQKQVEQSLIQASMTPSLYTILRTLYRTNVYCSKQSENTRVTTHWLDGTK